MGPQDRRGVSGPYRNFRAELHSQGSGNSLQSFFVQRCVLTYVFNNPCWCCAENTVFQAMTAARRPGSIKGETLRCRESVRVGLLQAGPPGCGDRWSVWSVRRREAEGENGMGHTCTETWPSGDGLAPDGSRALKATLGRTRVCGLELREEGQVGHTVDIRGGQVPSNARAPSW